MNDSMIPAVPDDGGSDLGAVGDGRKVFIGFLERVGQGELATQALGRVGAVAQQWTFFGSRGRSLFIGRSASIRSAIVNMLVPLWIVRLVRIIRSHDVFWFFAGHSMISLPQMWTWAEPFRYRDLQLLSRLGKTIVISFQGCDLRHYDADVPERCTTCPLQHSYCAPRSVRRRTAAKQRAFRWADAIVLATPDLLRLVPAEFHGKTFVAPQVALSGALAEWRGQHRARRDGPYRVVHAPSNPEIKGTALIEAAVAQLQHDGVDVELSVIRNAGHRDLFEAATQADLVIDQVLVGWYGVLAIEMMELGVPVGAYLASDALATFGALRPTLGPPPVFNLRQPTLAADILRALETVRSDGPPDAAAFLLREHTVDAYVRFLSQPVLSDLW